jgi:hypothetical protein
MLKRLARNDYVLAAAYGLIALLVLAGVSSLFGLSGEICDQTSGAQHGHCPRYNFVLVGLWKITEIVNWLSPALTGIATVFLTVVTYMLVDLGKKQAETTERQLGIAGQQADVQLKQQQIERMQFLATHRPWLEIRNVEIKRPTDDGPIFEPNSPIIGWLVIVNTGGSSARIINTEYRFFTTNRGLPMAPPLEKGQVKPLIYDVPHEMGPHESYRTDIEHAPLGAKLRWILFGAPDELYIMGAINYADTNSAEHWMGFCRKYVPGKVAGSDGRFAPIENSDYEYQD